MKQSHVIVIQIANLRSDWNIKPKMSFPGHISRTKMWLDLRGGGMENRDWRGKRNDENYVHDCTLTYVQYCKD